MKNFLTKKKGLILITVMLISIVFIIIIVPLIAWTVHEFSWTVRSFRSLKALNLADAGAEIAIWEIIYDGADFSGWGGVDLKTRTISSFTDNSGNVMGDIDISVLNTASDTYLITSTGHVPFSSGLTVEKRVKVLVFPRAMFNNGIFGQTSVTINGTPLADSYDSSAGPYTEESATGNCDIGTNGELTIGGNALVEGDVFVGPDGEISGDVSSYITGETYYSANPVELEDISLPDEFSSLENHGDMALASSDTMMLPSNDYYYESISLKAQSNLTLSSNTRIYIATDFSIAGQAAVFTGDNVEIYIGGNGDFAGGGIVNTTTMPSNLQIYGLGNDTNLTFSGNSAFYGAIYAPYSSVVLTGTSDYFGAVVGKDVDLTGTNNFHYDEDLRENGPTQGYDIAYWQEN